MLTDILIVEALLRNDINIWLLLLSFVTVVGQKLNLLVQFCRIIRILLSTLGQEQKDQIDQLALDKILISINYVNLSNILYQRVTGNQIDDKFLLRVFIKEQLFVIAQLGLKICLLTNEKFQTKCSSNNDFLSISIFFTLLCSFRLATYLCKRSDIKMPGDNQELVAVDYIQEYVHDE